MGARNSHSTGMQGRGSFNHKWHIWYADINSTEYPTTTQVRSSRTCCCLSLCCEEVQLYDGYSCSSQFSFCFPFCIYKARRHTHWRYAYKPTPRARAPPRWIWFDCKTSLKTGTNLAILKQCTRPGLRRKSLHRDLVPLIPGRIMSCKRCTISSRDEILHVNVPLVCYACHWLHVQHCYQQSTSPWTHACAATMLHCTRQGCWQPCYQLSALLPLVHLQSWHRSGRGFTGTPAKFQFSRIAVNSIRYITTRESHNYDAMSLRLLIPDGNSLKEHRCSTWSGWSGFGRTTFWPTDEKFPKSAYDTCSMPMAQNMYINSVDSARRTCTYTV